MELLFATHNPNKLIEVQAMMPAHVKLLSLADVLLHDDIPETADTIEGNAILKTDYITARMNYPVFADDTGLIVPALNGEPGVYSARYAGDHKNSDDNMNKLLEQLQGKDRAAYFQTVISFNQEGQQHLFTGECHGTILEDKRGDGGFGYDPIFKPKGYELSFAQMPLDEKARISHRGKALAQLIDFLDRQVNK
ncbi:non-canonical purine NTP diphosphatase [Nonlabens ponticola]|uniref:dITP/XTP pyrophosphatase n=1 Tax=Nonlabens ponticola TaxID=2496866 RepID=A0A3S9MZS6_9FLAO|nr:non-canonical purine NTP diphosphatase [Nonlabens ponticola]AZQ44658.1 non-canonical purine NTP diphosphatase [Nonlabens ponticola]